MSWKADRKIRVHTVDTRPWGKFDTGACEVIECCKLFRLHICIYMIFSASLPVSCTRILDYEEIEPRSLCPQIKTLKLVKSKVRSGVASSVLLASSQLGRYTWPDQKLAFQSMKTFFSSVTVCEAPFWCEWTFVLISMCLHSSLVFALCPRL